MACQQIAVNLWKRERTIASMVKEETIQELGGAKFYATAVVRKWLSAVAPPEVKAKRGRPRSNNDT